MTNPSSSRRRFLQAGCGLLASGAASSLFPQLGMMGTALAQTPAPGYRALVCLYLGGGNDAWNLLIPNAPDTHDLYVAARNGLHRRNAGGNDNLAGLAIPRSGDPAFVDGQTLPRALPIAGGQYAINPFAPELANLYGNGRLAFVANVGTLVDPLTRATAGTRRRPPQLYSHNDQTRQWHAGQGSRHTPEGWGGRVAARVAGASVSGVPPVISLSGRNLYLLGSLPGGQPLSPIVLSTATRPATELGNYAGSSAGQFHPQRRAALEELLQLAAPHPFTREYRDIMSRSLDLSVWLNDQIVAGGTVDFGLQWPNTGIANQLRTIARMIRVSRGSGTAINANRQVFFAQQGGYDTHDAQISSLTDAGGHHRLLAQLSQAVALFNQAMASIGAANDVTLFTASDFARTVNSNGSGTDHAWGNVQFVTGGAVNGGIYGRYPRMVLDNRIGAASAVAAEQGECFSRGQFLPTLATDQYAATLARWMGVPEEELPLVFPNLDRFHNGEFASHVATPTFAHFGRWIPGLMAG